MLKVQSALPLHTQFFGLNSRPKKFLLTATWRETLTFAKNRFGTHCRGDFWTFQNQTNLLKFYFQIITRWDMAFQKVVSYALCFVCWEHMYLVVKYEQEELCLEQGLMLLYLLTTVYLSHYAPATAHAQLHTTSSALDIMRTPGPIFCLLCWHD